MPSVIRKQIPTRPDGALGEWRNGTFHFDSPEAEQKWRIDAYRSGVHAEDWHHGNAMDAKTRDLVLGGLGGPTPPYYRGPDGDYRFANRQTIEPEDVRELRKQSFRNAKVRDIQGPAMPGEDVIAARFAAKLQAQSANDNVSPPANENAPPATDDAPKLKPMAIGRFAEMAAAQKKRAASLASGDGAGDRRRRPSSRQWCHYRLCGQCRRSRQRALWFGELCRGLRKETSRAEGANRSGASAYRHDWCHDRSGPGTNPYLWRRTQPPR